MRFFLRLVINAVAIYAAVALLNHNGLEMRAEGWLPFLWLALIFAGVNVILKPILHVIGCPLVILTLGLGTLLINTLLFYVTAMIGQWFNVGFSVSTFWGAFFGSIIVSIVSMVLGAVIRDR